ncbi:MAG: hypothetical protein UGF89_11265 [Acutalibacteraceae bacterium]|nr:hypothetical protein [Acutalibacteraceae bacterium]
MIIELLLDLVFELLKIIPNLGIPTLPEGGSEALYIVFDYIVVGIKICNVFFPMTYFGSLFGILIALEAGLGIYHFVMWVIKKIPMLGMS